MKFLQKSKDGGPESNVDAYFLIEIKDLFSIALLKFNKGTREKYHSHAFDAYTWFLKGDLLEERVIDNKREYKIYTHSIKPKFTGKDNLHRVKAIETSWCLTLRGKWEDTWTEFDALTNETIVLTHGRKIVNVKNKNK